MASRPTFYLTSAIPYANGAPHIGHAYERVASDAITRFKRLDGYDALALSGMDEHGQKMQQTAAREGVSPQALADRTATLFAEMATLLDVDTDDVVRTTQPRHHMASQAIWRRMQAKGDIYLDSYSGWYSVRDEAYFDEVELSRGGRRPASWRRPARPSNGWRNRAISSGCRPTRTGCLRITRRSRTSWFRKNTATRSSASCRAACVTSRSAARPFSWGVPVPDDADHVMYVWVDALTNYLTGTGFPDAQTERARYWPADAHVIGKDITRFHAIYWPAFLMSADLPLPKQIVVHGFLFNRGEKMSKSGRQRDQPGYAGAALRGRSAPILLPARGSVRAGTAIIRTRRSSGGSMPTSPTISAIWRSARSA